MEFFIPAVNSTCERDRVYEAIKRHLTDELGADFAARRIRTLHYTHNRKDYTAVVGQEESGGEGIVVAILFDQKRSLYLVCTPYRGVIKGSPIMVGEHDVKAAVDFDV